MEKILMSKGDAVNVWMLNRNVYGETYSKCLIATFRNKNWAEAFIKQEMAERPNAYSEYCTLEVG